MPGRGMSGGHGGLRKSPPGTTVKEAASEGKEKAAYRHVFRQVPLRQALRQVNTAFSFSTGCRGLIRPGTPVTRSASPSVDHQRCVMFRAGPRSLTTTRCQASAGSRSVALAATSVTAMLSWSFWA